MSPNVKRVLIAVFIPHALIGLPVALMALNYATTVMIAVVLLIMGYLCYTDRFLWAAAFILSVGLYGVWACALAIYSGSLEYNLDAYLLLGSPAICVGLALGCIAIEIIQSSSEFQVIAKTREREE